MTGATPYPTPHPGDDSKASPGRLARRCGAALLAVEAALLLAALPGIVLMFLGSLWEGGDAALKHRLLGWAMFAGLGNLTGVVLCGTAVATLARRRPGGRATVTACAVLLTLLAAGWVWVYQGYLFSDPSTLGQVALLTLPGLAGALLSLAVPEQTGTAPSVPS